MIIRHKRESIPGVCPAAVLTPGMHGSTFPASESPTVPSMPFRISDHRHAAVSLIKKGFSSSSVSLTHAQASCFAPAFRNLAKRGRPIMIF